MQSEVAISVHGLSKKYRLYTSSKERLKEALHPLRKRYHREFWALKEISFEVLRGRTLGILGRNGSGKSTLLQIIASVSQPTLGEVAVHGRVSALLELGAGFNPEFTGRDNVILHGAIMGISREEIMARIAAIEKFAGIGRFFDQPVKTYSSGMFVRLAFSAAINIDPDILIVDEALAVGDAEFQQRCFSKFKEFQEKGVTIVFVTHDMEAIVRHCQHAILLEGGRLVSSGQPKDVAAKYIDLIENRHLVTELSSKPQQRLHKERMLVIPTDKLSQFLYEWPTIDVCARRKNYNAGEHQQPSASVVIADYLVIVDGEEDIKHISSGQIIDVYFKIHFLKDIQNPCYGLALKTTDGVTIYALNSHWKEKHFSAVIAGEYRVAHFRFPLAVNGGDIFLDFGVDEAHDGNNYVNLTRRMAICHLVIRAPQHFHGLVDLNATIEEVPIKVGIGQ